MPWFASRYLLAHLDAPAPLQLVDHRGGLDRGIRGEHLEHDLVVLEGRDLADRARVVALQADQLVCEVQIAAPAVQLHRGELRFCPWCEKGGSSPGDPVPSLIGNSGEHLGVGASTVEADHRGVLPDYLVQLHEHFRQGDRQASRLARGEADRPPALVHDEGVVPSRLGDVATVVPALSNRPCAPVGDEVVVHVVQIGGCLICAEHRLGEGALDVEGICGRRESAKAGTQGAQVREALQADERPGIACSQVLGTLQGADAEGEAEGRGEHE